jgi:hypothetical protein
VVFLARYVGLSTSWHVSDYPQRWSTVPHMPRSVHPEDSRKWEVYQWRMTIAALLVVCGVYLVAGPGVLSVNQERNWVEVNAAIVGAQVKDVGFLARHFQCPRFENERIITVSFTDMNGHPRRATFETCARYSVTYTLGQERSILYNPADPTDIRDNLGRLGYVTAFIGGAVLLVAGVALGWWSDRRRRRQPVGSGQGAPGDSWPPPPPPPHL